MGPSFNFATFYTPKALFWILYLKLEIKFSASGKNRIEIMLHRRDTHDLI